MNLHDFDMSALAEFLSIIDATTNIIVKEGHKHYLFNLIGHSVQY